MKSGSGEIPGTEEQASSSVSMSVRGLRFLDRSLFSRTVYLLAARVPTGHLSRVLQRLRPYVVDIPRLKCVIPDIVERSPPTRLLVFRQDYQKMEDLPKDVMSFLHESESVEFESCEMQVGYDNMSVYDVLREIIPLSMDVPHSYEAVGHIAHVNLRSEYDPFKHVIGQVLLDKNPSIRTVVNKIGGIQSEFREFRMEVIAGEEDFMAECNENDCIYRFDFSSVYWNSRLQMEHGRLIREEFTPGDVVCDACAGVGPFALPAAKSGCHVIANDLNPTAVLYLHENIRINKLDNRVEVYNLDAMELMKLLVQKKVTFHHVIFNLPASAVPLLAVFRGLYTDFIPERFPRIHVYTFAFDDGDPCMNAVREVEDILRLPYSSLSQDPSCQLKVTDVRNVAPKKEMICVSFNLPHSVAVSKPDQSEVASSSAHCSCVSSTAEQLSFVSSDEPERKKRKTQESLDAFAG